MVLILRINLKKAIQQVPLILLLGFISCTSHLKRQEEVQKKPNIIFILVDDLGWTDLGCYGSTFYETPHIDALAQRSVQFNNAYTSSPVCSPTRASILTGKYPSRLGITDWIPGQRPHNKKLLGPKIKNELHWKKLQ